MTDNTQAELREQIETLVFARFYDVPEKQRKSIVANLLKLITADRKRVALEAKIDAVEHILNTMVHEAGGYCDEIDPDDITNYIAELKQELEKL